MSYRARPTDPAQIIADRQRRFERAAAAGQKTNTWARSLRAMAKHGVGMRELPNGKNEMIDLWDTPGAYGVPMDP